jgi:hypothetical protein
MKRIGMMGLSLVAAFALSALVAGSALAAKHTNTGPLKFTSVNENAPHLEIKGAGEVLCKADTAAGEITSATEGTVTAKFTGCESAGKKCTGVLNTGEEGNITTVLLNIKLGYINKTKKEVGTRFKPQSGTYNAEFECPGTPDVFNKVKGKVIGRVSPVDVGTETTSKSDLKKSGSEQEVQKFEGGEPKETLISEISTTGKGGPFAEDEGIQNADSLQTNTNQKFKCKVKKGVEKCSEAADPAEVKTGGASPEYGRCRPKKKGPFKDPNCQSPVTGKEKGSFEFAPIPS